MDVEARVDADEALAAIDAILERLESLPGFYRDLSEWWRYRQTLYFGSSKIPRNDPRTVELKGSAQPLVDTGNLRAATMRNQPFNLGDGRGATFGLRKGTPEYTLGILMLSRPRGAPRRDPVPKLSADERAEIADLMRAWIMEAVDGA